MRSISSLLIASTVLGGLSAISGPVARAGGDGTGSASRPGQTFVYACRDGEVVARIEGAVAWLFSSAGTVQLPRVRAASGVKFEDGEAMFWSKGEGALIRIGGRTYEDCRNDRRRAIWEDAKLRGVDFRAVGNEPGWVIEISERILINYVGDYGQTRLALRSQPPEENQAARQTRYTATDGTRRMTILIEATACHDSMSGEQFGSQVMVKLDGQELRGCGRALH